ncbi:MAG: hypothetical protein QOH59_806 [Gemmatimonadales bacterium]|jgi:hypothetical protein|nr:hypothetical protein [Gemmatimonadales bacterium]
MDGQLVLPEAAEGWIEDLLAREEPSPVQEGRWRHHKATASKASHAIQKTNQFTTGVPLEASRV